MIVELGHFALILALAVALVQMVLPAWGAQARDEPPDAGRRAGRARAARLCCFAFGALMHAYVTSDFSVENVWANSHSAKPLLYKISGVWGNHEGSMLLWVLILALFGAAVALFGRNLPATLRANVLAVQAVIAVAFLLFIVLRLQSLPAHPARSPRAAVSIRSCRTPRSPSTRRSSTPATSASRSPSPSPSPR